MTLHQLGCLEAMYTDILRLQADHTTQDITLECGGHRLGVHSFILQARSPVFRSMLNTNMIERTSREVHMEDADIDVVREMVNYFYSADLSPGFVKLQELLILANRYCVSSLVSRVGSLMAASLSPSTALQLGILGETHQADSLITASSRYIAGNLGCLGSDPEGCWRDSAGSSPRLCAEIVESLRQGKLQRLEATLCNGVRRNMFGLKDEEKTTASVEFSLDWAGQTDEVQPVFLVGMGLFTIPEKGNVKQAMVSVGVVQGLSSGATIAKMPITLCGAEDIGHPKQEINLPNPLAIQPKVRYVVSMELSGMGFIYSGVSQYPRLEMEVPHLGRKLTLTTHSFARDFGILFQSLFFKTHV